MAKNTAENKIIFGSAFSKAKILRTVLTLVGFALLIILVIAPPYYLRTLQISRWWYLLIVPASAGFFMLLEPSMFTTLTITDSAISIKRRFRKAVVIPFSEIIELRSWYHWGKGLRPTLKFQLKNMKTPLTAVHEFKEDDLQKLYSALDLHGIPVYEHNMMRDLSKLSNQQG